MAATRESLHAATKTRRTQPQIHTFCSEKTLMYLGVPSTWQECKGLFIWLMPILNLNAGSFSTFIWSSNINWRPMVGQALCLMLKSKAVVPELPFVRFHIKCHDMKKRDRRSPTPVSRPLALSHGIIQRGCRAAVKFHAGGTSQPLVNHRRYF